MRGFAAPLAVIAFAGGCNPTVRVGVVLPESGERGGSAVRRRGAAGDRGCDVRGGEGDDRGGGPGGPRASLPVGLGARARRPLAVLLPRVPVRRPRGCQSR